MVKKSLSQKKYPIYSFQPGCCNCCDNNYVIVTSCDVSSVFAESDAELWDVRLSERKNSWANNERGLGFVEVRTFCWMRRNFRSKWRRTLLITSDGVTESLRADLIGQSVRRRHLLPGAAAILQWNVHTHISPSHALGTHAQQTKSDRILKCVCKNMQRLFCKGFEEKGGYCVLAHYASVDVQVHVESVKRITRDINTPSVPLFRSRPQQHIHPNEAHWAD